MSAFTGELTVTSLDADCRRWRLEEPFRYEVGSLGSGLFIEAPRGLETDAASVPEILGAFLPSWGRYSRAAIIHDYLYLRLRASDPHPHAPTRREADRIFLEAMIVSRTARPLAWLMWAAVRLFGSRRGKPDAS